MHFQRFHFIRGVKLRRAALSPSIARTLCTVRGGWSTQRRFRLQTTCKDRGAFHCVQTADALSGRVSCKAQWISAHRFGKRACQ